MFTFRNISTPYMSAFRLSIWISKN